MGGLASATTVAANTMSAGNLLSNSRTQRKINKIKNTAELENKKNLLQEQLESRRASLSSMGLGSSSMMETSADKLTKNYYNDFIETVYDYKSKKRDNTFQRNSGFLDYTNKLLK